MNMLIEDLRFEYDLLFNDQSELVFLHILLFLWSTAALFTRYYTKGHVAVMLILGYLRAAFGWPFIYFGSTNAACIIFDILLLLASLYYLAYAARLIQRKPRRNQFRLKHTLLTLLLINVIPLVLAGASLLSLSPAISNLSGGYVKLTKQGIDLKTVTMSNSAGQEVHLIGMMHIGESAFYQDVLSQWKEDQHKSRLVLHEGVSDEQNLLKVDLDYSNSAQMLGLSKQPSLAEKKDDHKPQYADHLRADIDLSELDHSSIEILNKTLAVSFAKDMDSFLDAVTSYDLKDDEIARFLIRDLLEYRNDYLLEIFDEKAPTYHEVYIPWGALHLHDIENKLRKRQYAVTAVDYTPALKWQTLLMKLATRDK